jgi:hypothetical protein
MVLAVLDSRIRLSGSPGVGKIISCAIAAVGPDSEDGGYEEGNRFIEPNSQKAAPFHPILTKWMWRTLRYG